ncbi:sister chromatid cohesion protein PDS5 homolog D-like [Primulina eburnea]|uniref:sister chromatid cohesion protein PDS5 homolog D-like n=1 Tax=Primulina eburnea TaxID=1245227 RepID=UPI003C6C5F06
MGSSTYDDAMQREFAEKIRVLGNKLLSLPSAIDEQLALLGKAEIILLQICQDPLDYMRLALVPLMKAFVSNKLLRHTDENVQVAVASCFIELTRISAPKFTCNEVYMKEFLKLSVAALKHLSSMSGTNYLRALNILETLATVRTCLVLLDMECGELIVEMFQLFFNTIRPNHPTQIFKYMEMTMTLVIQESDEIPSELLKPLLDSIKMDTKNISKMSWDLGNTVFKNCSAKLQPFLIEMVKSLNLDVNDYAEIVASICEDASSMKNMVPKEASSTVTISKLNGLAIADPEDCIPHVKNGDGNTLVGESSLETSKACRHKSPMARYGVANEVVNAMEILPSEGEARSVQRRIRKPSLHKPEEGYELPWRMRDKDPCGSVKKGNIRKKKGRMINQTNNLDSSIDLGKSSRSSELSNGEDLVNSRIQVWWPRDKMYYSGTIVSFDSLKKKHKVLYDDGETEILNMDKEIWEPFDDQQDFSKQEADPPASAEEHVEAKKSTAKGKPGPFKKPKTSSSSKRLKGERGLKSPVAYVEDEHHEEMQPTLGDSSGITKE